MTSEGPIRSGHLFPPGEENPWGDFKNIMRSAFGVELGKSKARKYKEMREAAGVDVFSSRMRNYGSPSLPPADKKHFIITKSKSHNPYGELLTPRGKRLQAMESKSGEKSMFGSKSDKKKKGESYFRPIWGSRPGLASAKYASLYKDKSSTRKNPKTLVYEGAVTQAKTGKVVGSSAFVQGGNYGRSPRPEMSRADMNRMDRKKMGSAGIYGVMSPKASGGAS